MTFHVGETVKETGKYICVPCGYKKLFKKGTLFSSCLKCLDPEEKRNSAKGLELWEKYNS